tara:strand:+ start:149 stop:400 length:252 start_codon:yes stop_codon:yes gene_type:complete
MNKIYVGNLNYKITEQDLKDYFASCGQIEDVKIITDFNTNQSKGFGFITFSSNEEMEAAIEKNGEELEGRKLFVNKAREKAAR